VRTDARFAGVAAADVYLRHFETAVLPLLRVLPGHPARPVNARGRVAASADPAHPAGSLTRGPGFRACLEQGRPVVSEGLSLVPCPGISLVLVVPGG
jgi:hypothetical protein